MARKKKSDGPEENKEIKENEEKEQSGNDDKTSEEPESSVDSKGSAEKESEHIRVLESTGTVPEYLRDTDEVTKKSKHIDMVSAFALILSVFVFIMILKIHPGLLNSNIEHVADSLAKYNNELDQLNVEIHKLEKATSMERVAQEADNLKGMIESLNLLQQAPNPEIIELAEKIQKDITVLISLLEKKQRNDLRKLPKISN